MVVGTPVIKQEDGGRRAIIEIKVESASKPEANWLFTKNPIKSSGRYFIDIVKQDNYYIMILEIDDVILQTISLLPS